eukprot:sb/3473173/
MWIVVNSGCSCVLTRNCGGEKYCNRVDKWSNRNTMNCVMELWNCTRRYVVRDQDSLGFFIIIYSHDVLFVKFINENLRMYNTQHVTQNVIYPGNNNFAQNRSAVCHGGIPVPRSECDTQQEPTETSKQPIRTRYLGHVDWLSANQGPVFPDSVGP